MIRSESLDALGAALSAAQGEFEAVSKTANNPFFKSKYAALPEVVKAATPILASHGLAVWQGADTDESGEVLWTTVLHSSGQFIGSAARLLPVKGDSQAQGSAITYQRRYQYMSALGLVADDDDDGNAASPRSKPAARVKPASKPALKSAPVPTQQFDPVTQTLTTPSVSPQEGAQSATEAVGAVVVTVDASDLEGIRNTIKASGMTDDEVAWCLLSVGVESLPASPSRDDLKAAMSGMTVDQLVRFAELLTDDKVPGSGEAA